jgi:hypothetical protein
MTEYRIPQQEQRGEGRYLKAVDIFWTGALERKSKSPEVWIVETVYGSVNEVEVDRGTCTCTDYEIHTYQRGISEHMCKHKWAVNMKRVELRQNVREIVEAGYFGEVA